MKTKILKNEGKYLNITHFCNKGQKLIINDELFKCFNEERNCFLNIPIFKDVTIKYEGEIEYFFSENFSTSELQLKYEKENGIIGDEIKYLYEKRGSKNLIVTFPGFSISNIDYMISSLNSIKHCDFDLLAFEDNYSYRGTYCYLNNNGEIIIENYRNVIDEIIKKGNYDLDKVVLFGASKGGTTALLLLEFFPESWCFAGEPQIDVMKFLEDDHSNLFNFFDKHIQKLDISELLKKYVESKFKVFITYCNSIETKRYTQDYLLDNDNFNEIKIPIESSRHSDAITCILYLLRIVFFNDYELVNRKSNNYNFKFHNNNFTKNEIHDNGCFLINRNNQIHKCIFDVELKLVEYSLSDILTIKVNLLKFTDYKKMSDIVINSIYGNDVSKVKVFPFKHKYDNGWFITGFRIENMQDFSGVYELSFYYEEIKYYCFISACKF